MRVILFEIETNFPVELSSIDMVFNYSMFQTAATFKWQGWNGSAWSDLTDTLSETATTNNTYSYDLNQTGTSYSKFI